jgi:C_GCAxxG_C_C family probable redox protein
MTEVDEAVDCLKQGFSCSQAVLSAYCERFGLPREVALRLADGFGGGMGGLGKTCGAVTGAMMVLGLAHGRARADQQEAKMATRVSVRRLVQQFEACHGSVACRELLGCDIDTPERLQDARAKGLFATVCPALVRSAAKIAGDLLAE